MSNKYHVFLLVFICLFGFSCKKEKQATLINESKIEVVINDIPYVTDKYTRIGYTLKTWEYEKDNLVLQKIIVIDHDSKKVLLMLDDESPILEDRFPVIYKSPLPQGSFYLFDKITSYYISIQLPIPEGQKLPAQISHRFIFWDTIKEEELIVEGGIFATRSSETPITINSPVRGENWRFTKQSNNGPHFNSLLFINKRIGISERYATDIVKIDARGQTYLSDIENSQSYHAYGEVMYAVADGKVVMLVDSRNENWGNQENIVSKSVDDLAGNYLILDIGNGHYAFYMHCIPGEFFVAEKDSIKEGDPLGLIGNSGNSKEPHLHFQICDSPDMVMSNGLPFVLKEYQMIGTYPEFNELPAGEINSMMEENSTVSFPKPK